MLKPFDGNCAALCCFTFTPATLLKECIPFRQDCSGVGLRPRAVPVCAVKTRCSSIRAG